MAKKKSLEGIIVISTFPDSQSVIKAAEELVDKKRVCACVNFGEIRSIYRWKGRLENQKEYLAIFKTTKSRYRALKLELLKLHPYEVPEIIQIKANDVAASYLSWLSISTDSRRKK